MENMTKNAEQSTAIEKILTRNFYNNLQYAISNSPSIEYKRRNADHLKLMIKYLNSLKDDKLINEEAFSELLVKTCTIFIENEVEQRMTNVLNRRTPEFLSHLLFLSK